LHQGNEIVNKKPQKPMDSNAQVIIHEDLVLTDLDCSSSEEVIRVLGDRLYQAGHVNRDFSDAVIAREREFPTGLPCDIPVAIPHCDSSYCKHSAIALGILKNPVAFGEMGHSNKQLLLDTVFLLALNDPDKQVIWLKRLVGFLQESQLLTDLRNQPSTRHIAEFLQKHLLPGF